MDAAGISAADLADRSGLTEAAISYLRSGQREPSYRSLQRLTQVLPDLTGSLDKASPFDSIEDAVKDIRAGKMVIVLDDEDRENEGDLTIAAEKVTPEIINFMATHGRGLICLALRAERCDALRLPLMSSHNTSNFGTAFCESIDARQGVTTGISAVAAIAPSSAATVWARLCERFRMTMELAPSALSRRAKPSRSSPLGRSAHVSDAARHDPRPGALELKAAQDGEHEAAMDVVGVGPGVAQGLESGLVAGDRGRSAL